MSAGVGNDSKIHKGSKETVLLGQGPKNDLLMKKSALDVFFAQQLTNENQYYRRTTQSLGADQDK